jgi:hypothetical protein
MNIEQPRLSHDNGFNKNTNPEPGVPLQPIGPLPDDRRKYNSQRGERDPGQTFHFQSQWDEFRQPTYMSMHEITRPTINGVSLIPGQFFHDIGFLEMTPTIVSEVFLEVMGFTIQ